MRNAYKVLVLLLFALALLACMPFASFVKPTQQATSAEAASTPTLIPLVASTATSISPIALPPTATNTPAIVEETPQPLSDLYVFIQAPEGPLASPYVILTAFQSAVDVSIEITGILNSVEFVCHGSPCALPLQTSSNVTFKASANTGYTSEEVSATVRVELREDGYYVFIDSVSQFASFSDSCLRFWRIQDTTNPTWAEFVQFPYLLNTDKTLHYLTTQLILNGIVNVDGCPSGGLSPALDWPTGCGLERARSTMIEWQNKYDEYIWLASKEIGIPPKILKTLIEVESQFWPGNQRFYLDEIGLGQVNQLGVDILLRRNPAMYQQVCSTVLQDCDLPYTLLPAQEQAMLRGALVSSYSSICVGCQNGLDLETAKRSIPFIGQVLKANCEQVKVLVDTYQSEELKDDVEDPYTDLWKFTLLSYHSGISCFEDAVKSVGKSGRPMDWENVSARLECDGGQRYVDGFWGNLLSFDSYQYTPTDMEVVQVAPVFAPTRTPIPSPTPATSTAQVQVQVFLDTNQNGIMDPGEGLDGVPVLLQAENGMELSGNSTNGSLSFDLNGFLTGSEAVVSLPGLYRSETFEIPQSGNISILFRFDQPVLPTAIP